MENAKYYINTTVELVSPQIHLLCYFMAMAFKTFLEPKGMCYQKDICLSVS